VTAQHGFTDPVALAVSGLPSTVGTVSVTPSALTSGSGTAQVVVATRSTAPPGSYPLTLDVTSGTLHHTAALTLVVRAKDFALTVTPPSVLVRRGGTASYLVVSSATGGFTGRVRLTVRNLPPGATAHLGVLNLAVPGRTTLKVRTTATTPRGTYTVCVVAVKGSLVHQVTVTLVVR
jgi:hypothetical protein